MAPLQRAIPRRATFVIQCLGICFVRKKDFNQIHIAFLGCDMKWGHVTLSFCVYVRAMIDEKNSNLCAVVERGEVPEWRPRSARGTT